MTGIEALNSFEYSSVQSLKCDWDEFLEMLDLLSPKEPTIIFDTFPPFDFRKEK